MLHWRSVRPRLWGIVPPPLDPDRERTRCTAVGMVVDIVGGMETVDNVPHMVGTAPD